MEILLWMASGAAIIGLLFSLTILYKLVHPRNLKW